MCYTALLRFIHITTALMEIIEAFSSCLSILKNRFEIRDCKLIFMWQLKNKSYFNIYKRILPDLFKLIATICLFEISSYSLFILNVNKHLSEKMFGKTKFVKTNKFLTLFWLKGKPDSLNCSCLIAKSYITER